ncbi:hypothetical protein MVEN_00234400 [Mycena venus]|uniref:Uncharacterized protein n=1 Tax=Mycena venus TaxID=2733690 RepID=A0A8H6Z2A1_9AGAR|nr:hypothetical protein MVEN_00234400 [Mycena venus]
MYVHRKYSGLTDCFDKIAEDLGIVHVRNLTMGLCMTSRATITEAEAFAFPYLTHLDLTCKLGAGHSHSAPLVIEMLGMFQALQVPNIEVSATFPDRPADAVPPRGLFGCGNVLSSSDYLAIIVSFCAGGR